MWILVLIVFFNGPAITVVPTPYPSQERCEAAAKVFHEQGGIASQYGNCIPAGVL